MRRRRICNLVAITLAMLPTMRASAQAQPLGPSPRVTVAVIASPARGDAQTGSGFGTNLEEWWQTAPGFTLLGSVGYVDPGAPGLRCHEAGAA